MPTHHEKSDSSFRLEKLPVYGDLLKLYTLPAQGTIIESGELYEELQLNVPSYVVLLYSHACMWCFNQFSFTKYLMSTNVNIPDIMYGKNAPEI